MKINILGTTDYEMADKSNVIRKKERKKRREQVLCSFEIQELTLIVSYFSSALFFARDLRGPAPEKEKGECSVQRRGDHRGGE